MTETLATAQKRYQNLMSRQVDLNDELAEITGRRNSLALAAAEGDPNAVAEITALDVAEATANASLRHMSVAVAEARRLVDEASGREHLARAAAAAAAQSRAIDVLLEADDEIDNALDALRAMLIARDEYIRDCNLPVKATGGSMLLSIALEKYFDKWLCSTNRSYDQIERVAQMDGHYLKRVSPGMAKRGPRPLVAWERSLMETAGARFTSAVPGFETDKAAEDMVRQSGAKRYKASR